LALDDDQRHALARHLDGVGVPELVRREASPHAGLAGDAAQLRAGGGGRPRPPPVGPLTTQNNGPTGSSTRTWSQGASCSKGARTSL
jgi:hypothetical protein